jgi:hypothetical protein
MRCVLVVQSAFVRPCSICVQAISSLVVRCAFKGVGCACFCCLVFDLRAAPTVTQSPRQVTMGMLVVLAACLRVGFLFPPRLQLWGNAAHIAPELHREANRVSKTALVAELDFNKQVSDAFWELSLRIC